MNNREVIKIRAISDDMFEVNPTHWELAIQKLPKEYRQQFVEGWETWVKMEDREIIGIEHITFRIHPEDNRYCINFLGEAFEILGAHFINVDKDSRKDDKHYGD